MNKPIFLLVGKSASGKTTIAEKLESTMNLKSIQSYTTRPPRHEGETGHTFISNFEFDELEEIMAYTEYNGHRYCTTKNQLDDADLYVVDVPGVETLLQRYNADRQIVILYFCANVHTRVTRMVERHDSDTAIVSRLLTDEKSDWTFQILTLQHDYCDRDVKFHVVNADENLDAVLAETLTYVNKYLTEDKE